jgi:hypothetical protein
VPQSAAIKEHKTYQGTSSVCHTIATSDHYEMVLSGKLMNSYTRTDGQEARRELVANPDADVNL